MVLILVFVVIAIILAALVIALAAPASEPGKAIKSFAAGLVDFVKDKNNGSDEKRLFGCAFLVAALVYVFTNAAGPDVWTTAGGLAGVGILLLGVAGAQDGIVPKLPQAGP